MSSKGYASPLRIEARALPLVQRLYLLFCLLAVTTLLWLPLPGIYDLFLLLLFVVLATRTWKGRTEFGGAPVQLL